MIHYPYLTGSSLVGVPSHIVLTNAPGTSVDGELKLYVNGSLVDTLNSLITSASGADVILGNKQDSLDRAFEGVLDEWAVYDRILSASEISDHFAASGL